MSKSLPSIIPFTGKGTSTSMFYATTIQLGPDGVTNIPKLDSKRPYFGFATVGPGQTTGSHIHDGYLLLMITEGTYEVSGRTRAAGTVSLTEPRHASGECIPGPNGVKEILIMDSGYATIPFFKDLSDPRVAALVESAPGYKSFVLSHPCPPENPDARVHFLDRAKHGKKSRAGTAYPCQIGPAGFGASPEPNGTRPFAMLVEFTPGAIVPAHSHDGWTSIAVIEGNLQLSGTPLSAQTCVLLEPGTSVSYNVGDSGALVMQFFDTERAALPKFANAADAKDFAFT